MILFTNYINQTQFHYIDSYGKTVSYIHKTGTNGMAYSVDNRNPFKMNGSLNKNNHRIQKAYFNPFLEWMQLRRFVGL